MPPGVIFPPATDSLSEAALSGSAISAAEVEQQLHRLLQSPLFSHSRRYPGFLRYVVDTTLKGQQDNLKERSIGIDVFLRSPDYDLNTDPVVRVTAGEVRKRLAQYYYESEHQNELRIELYPGSYIPEFKLSPESRPSTNARPSPTPPPATARSSDQPRPLLNSIIPPAVKPAKTRLPVPGMAETQPGSRRQKRRTLSILLAATAGLLGVAAYLVFANHHSALDQFWAPALAGSEPVTLSVGSFGLPSPNPNNLTVGTHAESVSPVALADTITIANLQQFLSERSRSTRIQVSSQTTFSDLQRGTTVLVSAFDNQWTMRLTAPLRFHFAAVNGSAGQAGHILAIEDRENPGRTSWQIDQTVPYSSLTRDYAIIARFHDSTTEQMIVVAAGLGENGTIAAGQMLTNPQFFASGRGTPWNPAARNIEAVLETEVIDGKSGPPRIVAVTTW